MSDTKSELLLCCGVEQQLQRMRPGGCCRDSIYSYKYALKTIHKYCWHYNRIQMSDTKPELLLCCGVEQQ